jgi:transglutaminase-like putative cysteine protease
MPSYLLHQRLRYDYPSPIRELAHRLVVIPPKRHGQQRLVLHRLNVSAAAARVTSRLDGFGNHVIDVRAAHVAETIEFEAWAAVERTAASGDTMLSIQALHDRRLLEPSPLTRPDAALGAAAGTLLDGGPGGIVLARRITSWVHRAMRYVPDCTEVHTTAADALALGRGVCQDYAHVMLALCRLCGLPARYVSGHLLGEGGTHAWVEVLQPAPSRPDRALAVALDPTHDREAGASYLTVAVGRDYADVAPTSGTFSAACRGRLSTRKQLVIGQTEQLYGSFTA